MQDVGRLARFLRSPAAAGKRAWIVGFADADGNWPVNAGLALNRAAGVANALRQAGIVIQRDQLVSLSYMAPSACNDTDNGKTKNRRVEVWIGR